jgi:Leucine-rich repeat (LRR) protein
LSTGKEKIKCGFDGSDWNNTYSENNTFVLPFQAGSFETGCARQNNLEPMTEFEPLICYLEVDTWFDDICGSLLADACESGEPLGFNVITQLPNIQQFCSYHQCAYESLLSNETADYYACQCLKPMGSWDSEITECCNSKLPDKEEPDLSASCECYITPRCKQGDQEMCIAASIHCCKNEACRREYLNAACNSLIIPPCNDGNTDMCALAVDNCCLEGDEVTQDKCKRDFLRVGCDVSIQQNQTLTVSASTCCLADDVDCIWHYSNIACDRSLENNATVISDDCKQAVGALWTVDGNSSVSFCNFWEQKCNSYPGEACEEAVFDCCDYGDYGCSCDFYKYASSSLGYESDLKDGYCTSAALMSPNTPDDENLGLRDFYNETGGDDWFNNTGWLDDETSHCEWYGVKCNEQGQVSAINLNANNLQGSFVWSPIASLDKYDVSSGLELLLELEVLDLSNNHLSGVIPHFYKHQKLRYIDFSANNLHGLIDSLISPSLEYINVSHNSYDQVDTFKRFKGSHQTMRTLDLSYNSIHQDASEIFVNVPPNLRELILSDNMIRGTFPSPFEELLELKVFRVNNNLLSGSIPDVVRAFPLLGVLDLSNQGHSEHDGLTGTIPESLSNLVSLSVLDLSGNILV